MAPGREGGTAADPGSVAKADKGVPAQTITHTGTVKARGIAGAKGVGGVKICIHGETRVKCAQSAANGSCTLAGVPKGKDILVTFAKANHVTGAVPHAASSSQNKCRAVPRGRRVRGGARRPRRRRPHLDGLAREDHSRRWISGADHDRFISRMPPAR